MAFVEPCEAEQGPSLDNPRVETRAKAGKSWRFKGQNFFGENMSDKNYFDFSKTLETLKIT